MLSKQAIITGTHSRSESKKLLILQREEKLLIVKCCQNDRKAQEQLYKMFFDSMRRMCMKYTHDQDEQLTIINDGFMKVFLKIDQYKSTGSFEGWIRKIVFHTLSDYFRKKNKQIKFSEIDGVDKEIDNQLNDLYLEDIKKLLTKIPNSSREVFVKYHIEGYSHKEISKFLNIAEGTSKWHLSQARKQLQNLMANGEY